MEWIFFIELLLITKIIDLKFRKKIAYIFYLSIFLSLGFRYKLGWDYDSYTLYYNFFKGYRREHIGVAFTNLIMVLKYFDLDSQMLFFFVNAIKILTIGIIANKICYYRSLPLFVYMSIHFLFSRDLSNLRQSLGEVGFLLTIYFLVIKRKKIGLIFQLLGVFHNSLYISNVFLLGLIKKISYKIKIILLLTSIPIGYFLKEILRNINININIKFLSKYLNYLRSVKYDPFGTLLRASYFLLILFLMTYIIYCIGKYRIRNKTLNKLVNISYLGVVFIGYSFFLPSPIARIGYYCLLLLIYIIPLFIENVKNTRCVQIILIFIMLFFLLFCYEFIIKGISSEISLINRELNYKVKIFN